MKVSVITAVYNGEKYIEKTIQSVIGQTYPNIEYIIVDGLSTDNTLSIVQNYAHKITKIISEKDKGIADAFNKGIALATGEIIGLINADDWYEPNAVELVVKNIQDADITYGKMKMWNNEKPLYTIDGNHQLLTNEMTLNHPTVFVRKTIYEKYGAFQLKYKCAMDYDVLLRFYTENVRFKYIPQVIANMRLEGFSDVNWKIGCDETLIIKNTYLPHQKLKNKLYYWKHVNSIRITKWMNNSPLKNVLKWYRKNLSPIKKESL